MTGFITAMMTMLVAFVELKKAVPLRLELLFPTAIALAAVVMTMVVTLLYRETLRRRREIVELHLEDKEKIKKESAQI
jgi:predicted lysophospholipase L1 biosynthesis ABC-type transport system permease subunit